MRLTVAEARALAERAMRATGYDADQARIIADHLIDCELRGVGYGGLARALTIVERFARLDRRRPLKVVRDTPVSALVEGGDNVGYLPAHRATELAIDKARGPGIGVVGANDNWYTGMLCYYAEMAARAGLVSIIAANAGPWVAPAGGTEGRFGTNPLAIGMPAEDDPIIWDIGTSTIMHAEVLLAQRLGRPLPEGVAYGPDGAATRDPDAAFAGAFTAWGGHKGAGLGLMIQMLGMMTGAPGLPSETAEYGFLAIVIDPGLFGDPASLRQRISAYAEAVRATRPVAGGPPVRLPFERSAAERRRRLAEDAIEVPDAVYERLVGVVDA